jgi:hypothetical protein
MKTENVVIVLILGGLIGFLTVIQQKLVGNSSPYNSSWLFFFSMIAVYCLISTVIIEYKILEDKEVKK